jgi:ligand-binding sensor domain-containing protein/signal transduction histidine kinase
MPEHGSTTVLMIVRISIASESTRPVSSSEFPTEGEIVTLQHPRVLLAVALSVAVTCSAFALDPLRPITQYVRNSWTIEHGLPQNSVQTIAQTAEGHIWLGTQEGLVRFDGVRFTVYDVTTTPELKANNIGSLYRDRAGTLWVGTSRGVATYRDGRFRFIAGTENLRGVFGIRETVNPHAYWFGAVVGGLVRYADGKLTPEASGPASVYALAEAENTVWAGADDGVWARDQKGSRKIGEFGGRINAIYAEPGAVWFGGAGFYRYDGKTVTQPIADIGKDEILAITRDRNGSLWVGTKNGLWRHTGSGSSRLTAKEGLAHDYVDSLYEDTDGALWVGTHVSGVTRLYDGFLRAYTEREGLIDDTVWSVAESPDGTMWVGTDRGGLNALRDGKWARVPVQSSDKHGAISALAPEGENGLWVGTFGDGLYFLSDGRVVRSYTTKDGLVDDTVMALLCHSSGALWIGTYEGLTRLENGKLTNYTTKDGLRGKIVVFLLEDRHGRVWVSSGGGGRMAVQDGSRFTHAVRGIELPDERAFVIYEDRRGDMWFGVRGGVYRLSQRGLFHYTAKQGLPHGTIDQIFEDENGVFWMACPTGIFRVRRSDLDAVLSGRSKQVHATLFGVQDGLPAPTASGVFPSSWRRRDGTVWYATSRGVAVLDPRGTPAPLSTRPLVEEVRVDTTSVSSRQLIVVQPDQSRLAFHYTVPAFIAPKRVRFRYRLEGFDRDWIHAGDRRVAEYTNIPPGNYRFRVEAGDGETQWMSMATPIDVRRLPAIYQTPWFVAACALLLISMAWLAHQRRMHALRVQHEAIEAERQRIALELHDTVSTGITGTMLHMQSALDRRGDPSSVAEHLQTGKSLLTSTLENSKRVLWDLRSEREESADLVDEFRSMIEATTRGLPVEGTVEVRGPARPLRSADLEHHLLRIAQEAVTNALRHSGARRVALILEFRPKRVVLTVRDDGRGSGEFTLEELGAASHGVRGMRERAEQIGAQLKTQTTPGGGVEVIVEVEG